MASGMVNTAIGSFLILLLTVFCKCDLDILQNLKLDKNNSAATNDFIRSLLKAKKDLVWIKSANNFMEEIKNKKRKSQSANKNEYLPDESDERVTTINGRKHLFIRSDNDGYDLNNPMRKKRQLKRKFLKVFDNGEIGIVRYDNYNKYKKNEPKDKKNAYNEKNFWNIHNKKKPDVKTQNQNSADKINCDDKKTKNDKNFIDTATEKTEDAQKLKDFKDYDELDNCEEIEKNEKNKKKPKNKDEKEIEASKCSRCDKEPKQHFLNANEKFSKIADSKNNENENKKKRIRSLINRIKAIKKWKGDVLTRDNTNENNKNFNNANRAIKFYSNQKLDDPKNGIVQKSNEPNQNERFHPNNYNVRNNKVNKLDKKSIKMPDFINNIFNKNNKNKIQKSEDLLLIENYQSDFTPGPKISQNENRNLVQNINQNMAQNMQVRSKQDLHEKIQGNPQNLPEYSQKTQLAPPEIQQKIQPAPQNEQGKLKIKQEDLKNTQNQDNLLFQKNPETFRYQTKPETTHYNEPQIRAKNDQKPIQSTKKLTKPNKISNVPQNTMRLDKYPTFSDPKLHDGTALIGIPHENVILIPLIDTTVKKQPKKTPHPIKFEPFQTSDIQAKKLMDVDSEFHERNEPENEYLHYNSQLYKQQFANFPFYDYVPNQKSSEEYYDSNPDYQSYLQSQRNDFDYIYKSRDNSHKKESDLETSLREDENKNDYRFYKRSLKSIPDYDVDSSENKENGKKETKKKIIELKIQKIENKPNNHENISADKSKGLGSPNSFKIVNNSAVSGNKTFIELKNISENILVNNTNNLESKIIKQKIKNVENHTNEIQQNVATREGNSTDTIDNSTENFSVNILIPDVKINSDNFSNVSIATPSYKKPNPIKATTQNTLETQILNDRYYDIPKIRKKRESNHVYYDDFDNAMKNKLIQGLDYENGEGESFEPHYRSDANRRDLKHYFKLNNEFDYRDDLLSSTEKHILNNSLSRFFLIVKNKKTKPDEKNESDNSKKMKQQEYFRMRAKKHSDDAYLEKDSEIKHLFDKYQKLKNQLFNTRNDPSREYIEENTKEKLKHKGEERNNHHKNENLHKFEMNIQHPIKPINDEDQCTTKTTCRTETTKPPITTTPSTTKIVTVCLPVVATTLKTTQEPKMTVTMTTPALTSSTPPFATKAKPQTESSSYITKLKLATDPFTKPPKVKEVFVEEENTVAKKNGRPNNIDINGKQLPAKGHKNIIGTTSGSNKTKHDKLLGLPYGYVTRRFHRHNPKNVFNMHRYKNFPSLIRRPRIKNYYITNRILNQHSNPYVAHNRIIKYPHLYGKYTDKNIYDNSVRMKRSVYGHVPRRDGTVFPRKYFRNMRRYKRKGHQSLHSKDKDFARSEKIRSENEEELEKAKGILPVNIIESVFRQVQEKQNLKQIIGPVLRERPQSVIQMRAIEKFRDSENEVKVERTEEMLNLIMREINNIVYEQISSQTCQRLQPKLQEYLTWLTDIRKNPSSAEVEGEVHGFELRESTGTNVNQQDGPKFLFDATSNKIDSQALKKEKGMIRSLIGKYNRLHPKDKQKFVIIKQYLDDYLNILTLLQDEFKKYNSIEAGDNPAGEKSVSNEKSKKRQTNLHVSNQYKKLYERVKHFKNLYDREKTEKFNERKREKIFKPSYTKSHRI